LFLNKYLDQEMRAIRTSLAYSERIRRFQFLAAAVLKVAVVWYSLRLWGQGKIGVGEFVMATSMALLLITEARNLSRRFLEFFEFIGNVANGVRTLIRPHELIDAPDARPVKINQRRYRVSQRWIRLHAGAEDFRFRERDDSRRPAGWFGGLVRFGKIHLREPHPAHARSAVGTDFDRWRGHPRLHSGISALAAQPHSTRSRACFTVR
jgi:ATP-binding cassette subfamily B protein